MVKSYQNPCKTYTFSWNFDYLIESIQLIYANLLDKVLSNPYCGLKLLIQQRQGEGSQAGESTTVRVESHRRTLRDADHWYVCDASQNN